MHYSEYCYSYWVTDGTEIYKVRTYVATMNGCMHAACMYV